MLTCLMSSFVVQEIETEMALRLGLKIIRVYQTGELNMPDSKLLDPLLFHGSLFVIRGDPELFLCCGRGADLTT